MAGIFDKPADLKPAAMRTVAERRFDDARALCDTRVNARANGAQYLGGLVVEILLKALLVERHPQTARKRGHELARLSEHDRTIWRLIWRSHELSDILDHLPHVEAALRKLEERHGHPYVAHLKNICATWSIYARYSSLASNMTEAEEMLERVGRLKEVLR